MSKKFELDAEFSKDDLDTILDALDEWESKDLEMLGVIEKLKRIPDPPESPENPEYRENFLEFKRGMLAQEQRAKKDHRIRRERAVLLKAKLILMQQDKGINQLLNGDPDEESEKDAET